MVDNAQVIEDRHRRQQWRHPCHRLGHSSQGEIGFGWTDDPAHRGHRVRRRPSSSPARRGRPHRSGVSRGSRPGSLPPGRPPKWSRGTASTRPRSTVRWRAWRAPTTSCIRWRARSDFAEADRRAAAQLRTAAARAGVRRIIYLGGLGDERRVALDASEKPGRNGRGASREWRSRHRAPGVRRHRGGQPVVRDDSGAGRATAGDGVSALGGDAHAADRHRRCPRVSGGGTRPARERKPDVRDRRTGGGLLRRHDAGIRPAARAASLAAAGAAADAASVRPLARAGHAGAGSRRPRSRRRV